jgi:hypothetical protein
VSAVTDAAVIATVGAVGFTVPLTEIVTSLTPVALNVTVPPTALPTVAPDSCTFSVPPAAGNVTPDVPLAFQFAPLSTENWIAPSALTPILPDSDVPVTVTLPTPPAVPTVVSNPLTLVGSAASVGFDAVG